jgi:hypothetical protein
MIFDFWKPKPRKRGKLQPRPDITTPLVSKAIPYIPEPEPIPEVELEPTPPPPPVELKKAKTEPKKDWEKEFLKTFKQLTYRHSPWNVWRDFVVMFACSLSNAVDKSHYDEREALYMDTIKKYEKQEQALFPELTAQTVMALEDNPEQDFLGNMFMSLEFGNTAKGQFFTPYHICHFMAAIATDDIMSKVDSDGYFTIHDPCCGAGAMLIAGIHESRKELEKTNLNFQNHVLIVAQDIDSTVALMCYIQISLLGVAGYVKIGNSLTEPMTPGDSLENYWFTPIYFSTVWVMRRAFKKMDSLFQEKEKD